MANAVNNDPGRVRPVENYVRVRNYHETAEGACSGLSQAMLCPHGADFFVRREVATLGFGQRGV